jgi:hypothetical protein
VLAHRAPLRPRGVAIELSQVVGRTSRPAYLGYHIGVLLLRARAAARASPPSCAPAFGPLRLHRVEANIQPRNVPSGS